MTTKTIEYKKRLHDDAHEALRVFRKLANPLAAGAMPMVTGLEILAAEGIAFTFVQKAGAGLYGMGGHGFVIRKVTDRLAGDQTWSAPAFFKVRGAGVGFTLGYSNVESLVVIDTQAAVDVFIKNEASFDLDAGLALGKDRGIKLPGSPLNLPDISSGIQSTEYSISSGALIDFSLKGATILHDDEYIHAFYGPDVQPADVLSGNVPPPEELATLYLEMTQLACSYAHRSAQTLHVEAAALEAEAARLHPPPPPSHRVDIK